MMQTPDAALQLSAPGSSAWLFTGGVTLFVLLVLSFSLLASWRRQQWKSFAIGLAFGSGLLAFLGLVFSSSFDREVQLVDAGLRIRAAGDFYDETFDRQLLHGAQIRILARDELDTRQPTYRRNGIGLPGLAGGWYRCADKRNAFVVRGGGERYVLIETAQARLLLDMQEPEQFVSRLQSHLQRQR